MDLFTNNILFFLLGITFGVVLGYYLRKRMYFREKLFHIMYIQYLENMLDIQPDMRRYNFFTWDDPAKYEDDYVIMKKGSENDEE